MAVLLGCAAWTCSAAVAQSASSTAAAPVLQPTSVAYDAAGNLYFAESRDQRIERLGRDGQRSLVAGTGVEGFSGDGGAAVAAQLDSPRGVTVDSSGVIYIADTRNNRIRAVDPVTQRIQTIAGTGLSGYAGDGGPASAARLDLPTALALDGAGHLFVADTGNQRVRVLDLASGTIQTAAGNGTQGFSGDGGPALNASLSSPSGIAADPFGNLFIADSANQRVREVSATSHTITTLAGAGSFGVSFRRPEGLSLNSSGGLLIADPGAHRIYLLNLSTGGVRVVAGTGTQAYGGDQGLATLAMLDSPLAAAFDTSGQLAIADSGNLRIRLLSSLAPDATIATLVGGGARLAGLLSLSTASSSLAYGSVALLATPSTGPSTQGVVTLFDAATPLASQPLSSSGSAAFTLPSLAAGTHTLSASYAGDALHLPSQSTPLSLTVTPLPISVGPVTATTLYGQPIPSLQSSPIGVLSQDASSVTVNLMPQVPASASAGSYPVLASLVGAAAGNYVLPAAPVGTLTIARAPSTVILSQGQGTLGVSVASTTSGTPTGAVRLLTGDGSQLASTPVSATGSASLSVATLTPGTYAITAVYSGDGNFLPTQSTPLALTIAAPASTPAVPQDFNLNVAGSTTQTIHSGETATFSFAVSSTGSALAGPVVVNTSGGPSLASVTLDPTVISPGTGSAVVHLTVATPRAAALHQPFSPAAPVALAVVPALLFFCRRYRPVRVGPLALVILGSLAPLLLSGCGDRIAGTSAAQPTATSYVITVTGVSTTSTGGTLQHTASVTLNVL